MIVLHVGGNDSHGLVVSFITPNGSKEDPIPEEYLVAYEEGNSVTNGLCTRFEGLPTDRVGTN